jgi:uncharacterized protein YndB with AHSA1/START domain
MTTAIHQEIDFAAPPRKVYEALTDARQFSAFTGGAKAEIAASEGGPFSCFGGMISGRNIEMIPGQRLVQAWRAGNWPAGVYSIARFEMSGGGGATKLVFDHSGFPEEGRAHLEAGWSKMYWEPLAKYLKQS